MSLHYRDQYQFHRQHSPEFRSEVVVFGGFHTGDMDTDNLHIFREVDLVDPETGLSDLSQGDGPLSGTSKPASYRPYSIVGYVVLWFG